MAKTDTTPRTVRYGPYPEMTKTAIAVGYGIGVIITLSIAYASLILGFSIEGSELAAILGWAILRGIMGRASIVENNICQTIASSVNGASSGIMFTLPALFILQKSYPGVDEFNFGLMALACMAGGILGLCFVIPLRKQMIDFNRLTYPGGVAVAAVLRSPGAGIRKAKLLLGGAALSAVVHVVVLGFDPDEKWGLGAQLGLPPMLNITFYLSMLTLGVGYLAGKGGLWFGAGGFFCYWILAPLLANFGSEGVVALTDPLQQKSVPGALRGELFKPTGIGILIGAAVGGVFAAFPLIRSAIRAMQQKAAVGESDELPIKMLYGGVLGGGSLLVCVVYFSAPEIGLPRAIAMALIGILWLWVAGVIISECVGRTNWSPISGMTLIAVTLLVFVAGGAEAGDAAAKSSIILACMVMGASICVAMSQAGDMMLDLKSGYLVGAKPRLQQIGQMLATWLGPLIVLGLLILLSQGKGDDASAARSSRLPRRPPWQLLSKVFSAITRPAIATARVRPSAP